MNERILELARIAQGKNPAEYDKDDNVVLLATMDVEKFAELLIQECANRVSGMVVMDKGYIPQDPHSQGWNSAVAYAGKELKKYFGVES